MTRRLAFALCGLLTLMFALPLAAHAQESPQSIVRGTISVDGRPPPNLQTVITVTSGGVECGNTLPLSGFFAILVTCPGGVAFVNVNGTAAAQLVIVPGRTHAVDIVLPLATPIAGAPTQPPAGTPVATIPGAAPRPPATGARPRDRDEAVWLAVMTLLAVVGLFAGGAVAVRSSR